MATPGLGSTPLLKSLCRHSLSECPNLDADVPSKMLPNAKLPDNHLLIDPVAAVYDRSMPEYQWLRSMIVSEPAHRGSSDD